MYGSQRLSDKQTFEFTHLFRGFKHHFNKLALIGLIYVGCALFSYFIAKSITASLGFQILIITPEMLNAGNLTIETLQAYAFSMLLVSLVMMALMLPVFMAYWFSPALIILRNCDPIEALKKSFYACAANIGPFLVLGVVALVAIITISVILLFLWALSPILSLLSIIFSSLALMAIFYASMFTSFDDIFMLDIDDENNDGNLYDNKDNDDGPSTIIV